MKTNQPKGQRNSNQIFETVECSRKRWPFQRRSTAWLLTLALCLLGGLLTARGQDPRLTNTNNPADTNVSVGATVNFVVSAFSSNNPMTRQWYHNGTNLPGATNVTLVITNVAVADGGGYVAWITNALGGFTNTRTAILTVDPTFIKITSGAIVADRERSGRASWCDYDGDVFQDLFVVNSIYNGSASQNSLYRNNGDGTFTKITTNALSAIAGWWSAGAWADGDNDGDPDLYVVGAGSGAGAGVQSVFYRNDGNGRFTAVSIGPTQDAASRDSWFVSWGDYDHDGWVDLFIPTASLPSNRLFRNLGELNFKSMTAADVGDVITPSPKGSSALANWLDYDNDNHLDLYLHNWGGITNALYLNSGTGFFTRTFAGSIATNVFDPNWDDMFPYWADYDNDGYLDVFVKRAGFAGTLYRNLGGTNSVVVPQSGLEVPSDALSVTWGDYDNDGNLDLFIVNNRNYPYQSVRGPNLLFRNNGDGTFTEVDVGSPIWDGNDKWDTYWIDYDNDGFLDLFVAAGSSIAPGEANYLYRNNLRAAGNTNHWLKVRLVGKASNASGIGAKVRVTANIRGQTVTQLRTIDSPGYFGSNQGLLAHLGLGDATSVTKLRIEWPSGIVQELHDVPANQPLMVVESQSYTNAPPQFGEVTSGIGGLNLSFTEPLANARYILEASTDMANWTKLMARTGAGGTSQFTDTRATNYTSRFYRLQVP